MDESKIPAFSRFRSTSEPKFFHDPSWVESKFSLDENILNVLDDSPSLDLLPETTLELFELAILLLI